MYESSRNPARQVTSRIQLFSLVNQLNRSGTIQCVKAGASTAAFFRIIFLPTGGLARPPAGTAKLDPKAKVDPKAKRGAAPALCMKIRISDIHIRNYVLGPAVDAKDLKDRVACATTGVSIARRPSS